MMRTVLALLVLTLTVSAFATEVWTVDDTHSTARFKVRHMLVTNVSGEIAFKEGKFTIDPSDVAKSTMEAKLDAKSINTNNKKRDEHLRQADFFDTKKFPWITFKSKKITKDGDKKLTVTGDLTMHGVTKEVTLDSPDGFTEPVKSPWGAMVRGFAASGKLNRKDFGLNWSKTLDNGGAVVGDEVEIHVEFELKAAEAKSEKKG